MKTYWELKEELKEKYTDKQRVMRDMGRNQSPGASARKISSTAGNVVKHMGGAAVMPKDLARRKHGGAGMETDGPAPGHAAARGVKKVRGAKTTQNEISEPTVRNYMKKARRDLDTQTNRGYSHSGNYKPGNIAKRQAGLKRATGAKTTKDLRGKDGIFTKTTPELSKMRKKNLGKGAGR